MSERRGEPDTMTTIEADGASEPNTLPAEVAEKMRVKPDGFKGLIFKIEPDGTLVMGEGVTPEDVANEIARAYNTRLASLEAENEQLREALVEIAAFDDESANNHLERTGSYGAFDEPGSVKTARRALTSEED